jgi:hypothetical protein
LNNKKERDDLSFYVDGFSTKNAHVFDGGRTRFAPTQAVLCFGLENVDNREIR